MAQKKPTLASLVGGVSLQDAPDASPAVPAGPMATGIHNKRRLFKRLDGTSGDKLSVKAMMAIAGSDKLRQKRRDTKAKQQARHTLMKSARYQSEVHCWHPVAIAPSLTPE